MADNITFWYPVLGYTDNHKTPSKARVYRNASEVWDKDAGGIQVHEDHIAVRVVDSEWFDDESSLTGSLTGDPDEDGKLIEALAMLQPVSPA